MNLLSLTFILFCFITLLIYFIVPKKIQWFIILISSWIFLFYNNLNLFTLFQALLILVSSFSFGLLIDKYDNSKKKNIFLILGVLIILGLLFYLKYINLFIKTFNYFSFNFHIDYINSNSLIGMSYYSLIMIGYLIDVYRGTCKAEKNIFKCALFMSYFPILTSGPFIRYEDIKDKLFGKHYFNLELLKKGLLRILWGVFKILVISQRLSYYVDTVYGDVTKFNGFFTIVAILLFPLQLYTNFSGSIDIIMGISEILGINLPENFKAPFFSKTITEFWRNWHITLGAWLKDYIFYPLLKSDMMQKLNKICKKKMGKNGKKVPLYLSMLVMWILIGIWHGGLYTCIIGCGILQFIYIFLEDILEPISIKINNRLKINTNSFGYKLYQIIRTYILFSIAMISLKTTTLNESYLIIKNIFIFNPKIFINNIFNILTLNDFIILVISTIFLLVVDYFKKINKEFFIFKNRHRDYLLLIIFIFIIILFGVYGIGFNKTDFIYNKF